MPSMDGIDSNTKGCMCGFTLNLKANVIIKNTERATVNINIHLYRLYRYYCLFIHFVSCVSENLNLKLLH